jgi:glycosyltransferase involved in cell wall biosynthesis
MRILILNQFYPPDMAPTGQVAHDLARCLVARGHEVTALASRCGYAGEGKYPAREVIDGVVVQRVAALSFGPKSHLRKLLAYGSFYVATAARLALLRPRPDVVVALTTPPYIGLLARLLGLLRRWRRVHWIMDLYPDVMAAHGMLGRGPTGRLAASALRWLTRRELAGAAAVLTLGPDMAERCRPYVHPATRLEWVPLWAGEGLFSIDEDAERNLRRERGWDGKLVFLYSGNMGLGHRFGEFLAAAGAAPGGVLQTAGSCRRRGLADGGYGRRSEAEAQHADVQSVGGALRRGESGNPACGLATTDLRRPTSAVPSPIRFAFAGGGTRRAEIEAFCGEHPEAPLELLPYASAAQLAAHLRSADVLLASLEPAWVGCMLPSKLQGICATGRPVLFVGPRECSLARWIDEAGAGWVVAPGDVDGLQRCIDEARHPAERARRGAAARAYAATHFDREQNSTRIAVLIETVGA